MPGFDNGVMFANNVDFTGANVSSGTAQVVADGQLLIGSAVAPNIRVGSISVGTAMSTTFGAGSISIDSKIQYVKKTVTSAQFKSISTSPIELVPAQGANTIISVISASAKFVYGGNNAFTLGSDVLITYSSLSPAIANGGLIMPAANMRGTVNLFSNVSTIINAPAAVGVIDNVALQVFSSIDFTGNASNDNSLIVEVIYWISSLI